MAVSREEMRELDRKAIEEFGIPGALLMENAGRNVAEEVIKTLDNVGRKEVAILCGKGNNGGDGFVATRHLYNRGYKVKLFLLAKADTILSDGDAGLNLKIILRMDIKINEVLNITDLEWMIEEILDCAIIVDAIFGTGLKGEIREPIRSVIERVNRLNIPIISVDIPSGLDCNEGSVLGVSIKATKTVTFGLAKKGFFINEGPGHVGNLVITDISIPRDLLH